jgi:hypothetical protein
MTLAWGAPVQTDLHHRICCPIDDHSGFNHSCQGLRGIELPLPTALLC